MKKVQFIYAFLLCSLFFTPFLYAQEFYFGKNTHDFGQIPLTDSLKFQFWFVNNSAGDAQISKIETDCACTIANYPRQILKSGEGGYISLLYLPYHIGTFNKSFFVFDGKGNKTTLTLKGELIEKKALDEVFSYRYGTLNFKTKLLNFGFINTQNPVTKKFEVYNSTDKDFVMDGKIDAPAHIKVMYDSSHIIQAGQVGSIYITYDAAMKKDYSYVTDTIAIFSKDTVVRPIISASIEAYFPPMTDKELKTMPICYLPKREINLGTISKADTIFTSFSIQNRGAKTLKIYKILFSYATGSEKFSEKDLEIKAGETKTFPIWFAKAGRNLKKPQTRNISLFTNDPKNHIVSFKMKAAFK